MNTRNFFKYLIVLSLVVAIALFFFHLLPQFRPFSTISWISLLFFITLSLVMYFAGYATAISQDKNAFSRMLLFFTASKMMLSVLILIAYYELSKPVSGIFVVPFLGIYVVYTIFETWFMMKLAKLKP